MTGKTSASMRMLTRICRMLDLKRTEPQGPRCLFQQTAQKPCDFSDVFGHVHSKMSLIEKSGKRFDIPENVERQEC
jgi:hypothetical protein